MLERLRRLPAPVVTALLIAIVVVAVVFWGRQPDRSGPEIAHVARTRAKLFDGICEFAADVQLQGRFGGFAFARDYLDIRDALVDLLHTKSTYMVRTAVARESLRAQMLDVVNRTAGHRIASELRFTSFVVL